MPNLLNPTKRNSQGMTYAESAGSLKPLKNNQFLGTVETAFHWKAFPERSVTTMRAHVAAVEDSEIKEAGKIKIAPCIRHTQSPLSRTPPHPRQVNPGTLVN